jgi:4-amino-4-deoxy-L-arabinose transferase-like glycosyltransferase
MERKDFIVWCFVILFVGLGCAYAIMGYGVSANINEGTGGLHPMDRICCIRYAQRMLKGDFSFYNIQWQHRFFSEKGRLYTYPPVSGALLLPLVFILQKVGIEPSTMLDVTRLPFILMSGIAVLLVIGIAKRYDKRDMTNEGIALVFIFLFSGLLFYSVVKEGKFEGVVAFFLLLGLLFLPKAPSLSRIFFGLAISTKQVAVLPAIPTFLIFLRQGNYKGLLKWVISIILTGTIVLAPFIYASSIGDVYTALVKNFDYVRIQDNTLTYRLAHRISLRGRVPPASTIPYFQLAVGAIQIGVSNMSVHLLVLLRLLQIALQREVWAEG